MEEIRTRLIHLTALCSDYCVTLEDCASMEKEDLVNSILGYLPRIYFEFHDIDPGENTGLDEWDDSMLSEHLDEEHYESVRTRLATAFGEDDTYLETFERDMKYSESPIAASVSENLADIFQPLFNFVVEVRESEGDNLEEAYRECRESFMEYWSQTLCNVMRALNAMRH